jgi:hypothetical protein
MKKLKQIDITNALELAKNNDNNIYVITNPDKPVVKSFNKMSVGDVLAKPDEFIFFVIEEA